MRIFTVFSPHPSDYPALEKHVILYYRNHPELKPFIVKETGKNGNHPHLNLLWTFDRNKKYISSEYTQKLLGIFLPTCPNSDDRLIKNKYIFDEPKLRNGYLRKENDAKILLDNDDQELQDLQKAIQDVYQDIRDFKLKKEKLQGKQPFQFDPKNPTHLIPAPKKISLRII